MTTPYTWSSLQTGVATALVQGAPLPADFVTEFPLATSYAEGRIARDLVLVNTRATDTSLTTTSGNRALPSIYTMSAPLVVPEYVGLVVSGVTVPFLHASLDVINMTWPQQGLTLSPTAADIWSRFWTLLSDSTIVLCPTPDQTYTAAITGLFVQTPLSNSNQSSYISKYYGDLMFAATMLFLSGALIRNYGAQADEPQQAVSWEKVYQDLLPGAKAEELRRRGLLADDATERKV